MRRNEGKKLLSALTDEYKATSGTTYWQQFGYTVAGPVCFAYAKWLSERLDAEYAHVTDVVFVARDGYLLKKIYDVLPHGTERKTHYVYAPRSINLHCRDMKNFAQYQTYLKNEDFGPGAIAVVDTATMHFSAQRLISASIDRPVYGFYWVVLYEAVMSGNALHFEAFQKERYHTVDTWNIMEFIMSSPEPPVQNIIQGHPIYYQAHNSETRRIEIFEEMSHGILEFVQSMSRQDPEFPYIPNSVAVQWINDFLRNPTAEDMEQFRNVQFSERPDHSDCIPLNPFQASKQPAILRRTFRIANCVLKPFLLRLIKRKREYRA